MVAAALAAISAGLPGHCLEKVMGAVSFAHEDTHTPMYTALCGLATALAGALILFPYYGHVGIAAAIALSGWVGATVLAVILRRRGWLRIEAAAWRRVPRIILATLVMGTVIAGGDALLASLIDVAGSSFARIATLGLLVVAGLGVYVMSLQVLGVTSAHILIQAVAKRF
jgi:putative peptidoglycan lipid II flippase